MTNKLLLISALLIGFTPLFSQSSPEPVVVTKAAQSADVRTNTGLSRGIQRGNRSVRPGLSVTEKKARWQRRPPASIRLQASSRPGTMARMYHANGREVAAFPLSGTEQSVTIPNLQAGEYTLRIEGNTLMTRSILIL